MAEQPDEKVRNIREPSYLDAFIPLVTLIVLVSAAVALFGLDAVDGPIPVALILSSMVVALVVLNNGYTWEDVVTTGKIAFESIVTPIFILLAVGSLIGTWNMSGTIPTLVYYGIHLLQPSYFYVASAIICGFIALSIGSSWTTAGTIGVGLVGLASLVGVSPAVTAGAVISGDTSSAVAMPTRPTPIVPAVVHELPMLRAMTPQIRAAAA